MTTPVPIDPDGRVVLTGISSRAMRNISTSVSSGVDAAADSITEWFSRRGAPPTDGD